MEKLELKVNGMHCSGCENRIKNAILQINGIEKVIANYTNKTVEINYSKEVSIEEIKEKIEDLGFEVEK